MKYYAPYGSSDPNAPYVNGDPLNGVAGSIPDCRGFEEVQREVVAAIAAAGLTPGDDATQLAQVLRSGIMTFTSDLSTAPNTLVLVPAFAYTKQPLPGTIFRFKATFAPSGDTVAQINGLAGIPVRNPDGSKLTAGAYPAGAMVTMEYDGTYLQLKSGGGSGGGGIIVTTNQVLTVPSALYPDLGSAITAFSKMIPAAGVLVTINVVPTTAGVPYEETRTAQNGPLDIRLPYGNQLQIVAPALNGAFPTQADLAGKTKAQVLSLLRSRFNCIIDAVAVDGIQIHSGGINLLKNVLVVGDGTAGCSPIRVGDWQNDIGTGFLGVQNVWTHGGGQMGVYAMFLAAVRGTNLGASYNTLDGMRSAHGCNIEVNFGSLISMYNGGSGGYAANDGQISVDSSSGTMDFAYNAQHGLAAIATGKFNLLPATGVRLNNNGQWGAYAFGQGLGNLPSQTTFGGNSAGDIYAGLNSDVTAVGASVGTCSPSRNSNGNNNSYIAV